MSRKLPEEDPFQAFPYKLKWQSITRREFDVMYKRWLALNLHSDKFVNNNNEQRAGTAEAGGVIDELTMGDYNGKRDDCLACFDWWDKRKEGPEYNKSRSQPGRGTTWSLTTYSFKPPRRLAVTNTKQPGPGWEPHRYSRAPLSTSISIFSHDRQKIEHANVFSLLQSRITSLSPEETTYLELTHGDVGFAYFVRQTEPPEALNRGWFAICPSINLDTKVPDGHYVQFRLLKKDFQFMEKDPFECGLDRGVVPNGFEFDPKVSTKEDVDQFRRETWISGEHVKIKLIHLYGTHVTDHEKATHFFDPIKVNNRRVLRYIAHAGSVMAISNNERTDHFCARNPGWIIFLVFDKSVYRIAELKRGNPYVEKYWNNPSNKTFRKLSRHTPRPSEWMKFM